MHKVKNLKSPRVIKTHLSIDMLPEQVHFSKQQMNINAKLYILSKLDHLNVKVLQKKAKIIYVTRNPRDAVVRIV